MLFAPKAGSELRNQLGEQAGRLRTTAADGYQQATEKVSQGYQQATEKVSQIVDRGQGGLRSRAHGQRRQHLDRPRYDEHVGGTAPATAVSSPAPATTGYSIEPVLTESAVGCEQRRCGVMRRRTVSVPGSRHERTRT